MRLYKFTAEWPYKHTDIELFYLAENDLDFLQNCVAWAHDSKEIPKPEAKAPLKEWRDYHQTNASYHRFMATALIEHSFDNKIDETIASWESWEISEADIGHLERLHVLSNAAVPA